jgi:hypothetical protein
MEPGSYCGSPNGERASEWQRRLAVNQFGRRPIRRFESCRSHQRKRVGKSPLPSTPNRLGTGLLSRPELVRVRPTAPRDIAEGQKL